MMSSSSMTIVSVPPTVWPIANSDAAVDRYVLREKLVTAAVWVRSTLTGVGGGYSVDRGGGYRGGSQTPRGADPRAR